MNDLITIVIPVYNVEKYIRQCLDSVINQTYNNLEIIIVDDGTRDNSGIICDEYACKDNRIKVIHKTNGGLSDARNVGIDNANGKYITFIDSDDYIEINYIEELYKVIINNNLQMSQCDISRVDDNNKILETIGYDLNTIKSGKDLIKEINSNHWIENIVVWNKMYDINLFDKLRYPVGKINEDEFITYKILYNLDRIAIIDKKLYNYRKNNLGITEIKFNLKRLDGLQALEERLEFFKKKGESELYELTLKLYFKSLTYMYVNVCKYFYKENKIKEELILKYKKVYKLVNKKYINKREKMLYFIPKTYGKLCEIKYKLFEK